MNEISKLLELEKASIYCDNLAFNNAKEFSNPPQDYDQWDWERRPPKSELRQWHFDEIDHEIEQLDEALERWKEAAYDGTLDIIFQAIGIKAVPICVGEQSYPSAHQAAFAYCEAVMNVLRVKNGCCRDSVFDTAREIAKTMLPLRRESDLYGRLEQEHWAAIDIARIDDEKVPIADSNNTEIVVSSNDPRDEWLYKQCNKLVRYRIIESELAKKNKWEPLSGASSIKKAANSYAKRRGLPLIPPRQKGRPTKK
jgi:hypothetical protein